MNRDLAGILLGVYILIFGLGCATVRETLTQRVMIASSPSWADFRVVGDPTIYNTPSQLELSRNQPYIVRLEKDGYEPVLLRINVGSTLKALKKQVDAQTSNWNVEALSEARYRVVGDMIIVTLKPIPQPQPELVSPIVEQPSFTEEPKSRKTLEERLLELNHMRKKGKISAKEYKALKKKAVEEYK